MRKFIIPWKSFNWKYLVNVKSVLCIIKRSIKTTRWCNNGKNNENSYKVALIYKKLYLTYSATFTNVYYLRLISSLQVSLFFKIRRISAIVMP